jgi:hypothetical protein
MFGMMRLIASFARLLLYVGCHPGLPAVAAVGAREPQDTGRGGGGGAM